MSVLVKKRDLLNYFFCLKNKQKQVNIFYKFSLYILLIANINSDTALILINFYLNLIHDNAE
jgi:hypothetical protein